MSAIINNNNMNQSSTSTSSSSQPNNILINNAMASTSTTTQIHPVHQRTRSLPLTEENAIQMTPSSTTWLRCSCHFSNKIQNTCPIHSSSNKSCSFLLSSSNNNNINGISYNELNNNNNHNSIIINVDNSMESIIEDQTMSIAETQTINIMKSLMKTSNTGIKTSSGGSPLLLRRGVRNPISSRSMYFLLFYLLFLFF